MCSSGLDCCECNLWNDFTGFHVKTFFDRFTHRESLAWQRAVEDDGFEQVALIHAGQVKTAISRFATLFYEDIRAVDVIDFSSSAFLEPLIDERLQRSDRQIRGGILDHGNFDAFCGHQADTMFRV